jgi:molybdate transport system substrate-binding protein
MSDTGEAEHQYGKGGKGALGWLALSVALVAGLAFFLQKKTDEPGAKSLTVYCAAGIQLPVEEAARQFEKELGVKVHLEYASSGVLANKLKLDQEANRPRADVYIPADFTFTERARADGLTAETLKVASWKIVLAVKPGAGIDVKNIDELLEQKISFVICEPLAGAGKKTKKVLQAAGKWEAVDAAKTASFPTVPEAALAVKETGTQAAFLWNSTAAQHGLKVIELPELEKSRAEITVAVTATTDRSALALQFARFLAAPEMGGKVFTRHKYEPIAGDRWAKKPVLRVDCGGVNREAVEKTIREFMEREGCEVRTVYDGCGTLVSKMQTSDIGLPDVFLTCDASYLDKAQDAMGSPFGPDLKVSSTRIVMLVAKGNPKGLKDLAGLARAGLRIGTTDPKVSTLGALSHDLFRETGHLDAIKTNITKDGVMTDTAHTLIQTMEAGGKLDVALVYEANIQHLKDKFDFVPLAPPRSLAVQNIAANKSAAYPQLAQRLMQHIISDTSKRRFEQLGFQWVAGAPKP